MQLYTHVRILIAMIVGLAITRILTGLSRFVQHPKRNKPSPVHLIWVFVILLAVIHFWWWEFSLQKLEAWHFTGYVFVLFYAVLHFLLATLLFPDDIDEYSGYEDYLMSRRRWFFGLFGLMFLIDYFDTGLKGADHLASLGPEYPVRLVLGVMVAAAAFWSPRPRVTALLGAAWLIYDTSWIIRTYGTLAMG